MQYTVEEIIHQMGQACEVLEDSETKKLYLSCLNEMCNAVIGEALIEAWSAPELLEKWSGTPWHYKRLQKALEAAALDVLPEGSRIYIYAPSDSWSAVTISAWCPFPGCDAKLLDGFMPWAFAARVEGEYCYQIREGSKSEHRDFPAFNELLDACCDVTEAKSERDSVIMEAIAKANAIREERSLGLVTLKNAIAPTEYRL